MMDDLTKEQAERDRRAFYPEGTTHIVTVDANGVHEVSKDSEMSLAIQEIFKNAKKIGD